MERLGPAGMKTGGRAKVAELRRELERLKQEASAFEARVGHGGAPAALQAGASLRGGEAGQGRVAGGGPAFPPPAGHSAASWT